MITRFMSQVLLWIVILIFVNICLTIDIISENATAELTNEIDIKCDENYNENFLLWLSGFGLCFLIITALFLLLLAYCLLVYCLKNSQCLNCIRDSLRNLASRLTPNFYRPRQEPPRVTWRRPRVEIGMISIHQNTRTTVQRNNEM